MYGSLDRGMVILQLYRWKFSDKETLQQTFVMQYNMMLTYSMFMFSDRTLSAIKYRIYGIKRHIHVILSVRIVYQ